jgi:hypothetical protein
MGTWGPGNFDSDDALEILEEVANIIQPEIAGFMMSSRVGYEDLGAVLACLAVENALISECGLPPRDPEKASAIHKKVVAILDAEGSEMISDPAFLAARREAIESVLGATIELSRPSHDGQHR